GVSWVVVVVVNPHATCLDIAASAICGVLSTCPHTSAQAIVGVIGHLDGLVVVLKGCYCQDWCEASMLADLHVIGATAAAVRDVVAVFESVDVVHSTAEECLRAFFWAGLEVRRDLIHLINRCLLTQRGLSIERVANLDGLAALDGK